MEPPFSVEQDPPDEVNLDFAEFAVATYDDWRKEAEAGLNGAPFEKCLVTRTREEIDLQPVYSRNDLTDLDSMPDESTFDRGARTSNAWKMVLPASDRTSVSSESTQTVVALKPGPLATFRDFSPILDSVDLERCAFYLEAGPAAMPVLSLLVAWLRANGKDPVSVKGCLIQDPLGELVAAGSLPYSLETAFAQMERSTAWVLSTMPEFRSIAVRTDPYHNAGATAVQEIAYALATGVEYLRQMEESGLKVNDTAPRIQFSFAIGPDFFMAIAKFRAARLLWSRIVEVSGGNAEAQKMFIHARTSLWNRTRLDPHVNLLRCTTEAFAAIAAGCDSLEVGTFDEAINPPNEFSSRIARNTQLILREECHFDHVVDPAGGSYFVETLTRQLANKAWELFRSIESSGGMTSALLAGLPQEQVNAAWKQRAQAIASRKNSLIGVNVYANPKETVSPVQTPSSLPASRDTKSETISIEHFRMSDFVAAAARGATLEQLALHDLEGSSAVMLPVRRAAEPFEDLRVLVEAAGRPKVFLATMGSPAQYKARADFSRAFFETGGFQVVSETGFATVLEAAAAAERSNARIVVLCSTDATYPELVGPLCRSIRSRSARTLIVLAGFPEKQVETFREAGVEEFIHLRSNCYETLLRIAERIGVKP